MNAALGMFTAAGTGAVPRTVQDKLREVVSILDYGADPTGSADSTAAIQAAYDALEDAGTSGVVFAPKGVYKLTDKITVPATGSYLLQGHGRGETVILIDSASFNMSATAVFEHTDTTVAPKDSSLSHGGFEKFTVRFVQPDSADPDDMNEYPWAFVEDQTGGMLGKVYFRNITIEQAWDCVSIDHSGGGDIEGLWISAYNTGLQVDHTLDDLNVHRFRSWIFGGTDNQNGAYTDNPNYYAIKAYKADGFTVSDSLVFGGKILLGDTPHGGSDIGFSNCKFDQIHDFRVETGIVNVTNCWFASRDYATITAPKIITQVGGKLSLNGCRLTCAANATGLAVDLQFNATYGAGPHLFSLTNSHVYMGATPDQYAVYATCASGQQVEIILRGNYWEREPATTYAAPVVYLDDGGVGTLSARVESNVLAPFTTGSSKFLNVATDGAHVIAGNLLTTGWTMAIYPAGGLPAAGYEVWHPLVISGPLPTLRWNDTTGAADIFEMQMDAGVLYSDRTAAFGQWSWRGPSYVQAMNLTTGGDLTTLGHFYRKSDTKVYWDDTTATPVPRAILWADGSNDFHVGYQAAPNSGNGALSLYAKGAKIINILGAATPTIAPETDDVTILGTAIRRFMTIYAKAITLSTIGAVPASISLQSADGATESVTLYGQAEGTDTYGLWFPPEQGAAGTTLVNDGSGVFSWAANALPAGTANYTLRYNGTSNLWEASGLLTNDATSVSVLGGFGADAVRVFKPTNRAVYWTSELSADGASYYLKDSGPNIVLQFDTSPTRNGFLTGNWLPSAGATYSLGASGYAWTKLWTGDIDASGKVVTYNGAATAGVGLSTVVASVTLTGQSASISATNLLASAPAGFYRITYYTHVTTAGAAGSLTFSGAWTYNSAAKTNGNGYADVAVDEGYRTESFAFQSDNANITYAMALSGGSGVAYSLSVILERLN